MTEHVHEWELTMTDKGKIVAYCNNQSERPCVYLLDTDELNGRLNEHETLKAATERLSAEDARRTESCLSRVKGSVGYDMGQKQLAYANILEGKR